MLFVRVDYIILNYFNCELDFRSQTFVCSDKINNYFTNNSVHHLYSSHYTCRFANKYLESKKQHIASVALLSMSIIACIMHTSLLLL